MMHKLRNITEKKLGIVTAFIFVTAFFHQTL